MPDREDSELATIEDVECIRETDLAVQIKVAGKGRRMLLVWLPKSQIHDDSEVFNAGQNATGKLVIPNGWLSIRGWYERRISI